MKSKARVFFFALLCLLITQCASYTSRTQAARQAFESGQYDVAIERYNKLAEGGGNDLFLYLTELGMVYFTAGRYAEAIQVFHKADKLAEIKDYTSITEEAATVILNEGMKAYRGEDFEKILVNVYLAMAYTLSGKWESALVECRRVNHKLDMMISKGQLPYERNAFAKYLAAMLFEARREYNDAFVDYRQLLSWKVVFPGLPAPLLRLSKILRATQEFGEYRKRWPKVQGYQLGRKQGEVVVLLEQGRSPIKVPSEQFRLVPRFQARSYGSKNAVLRVEKVGEAPTHTLMNVEQTAIRQLDKKMGIILAKKIGGVVVKQVIADRMAKASDSKLVGFLTSVVLHATDRADLRSWTSLPATLQVARLKVPAGRHNIDLDMVTHSGRINGAKRWENVEVKPGQKVFLNYRWTQ